MPARYVEVSREEMDALMERCGFVPIRIEGTGEQVYQRTHDRQKDIAVRVYSTVPLYDSSARGCGEDAIRVVLTDLGTGVVVWSATRTHRTQSWSKRLHARMREAWMAVASVQRCSTCGGAMVRRQSKSGAEFLGCSRFPTCRQTAAIVRR